MSRRNNEVQGQAVLFHYLGRRIGYATTVINGNINFEHLRDEIDH